jgi:pimeloyl-ACP methyl ester carboxylesterase
MGGAIALEQALRKPAWLRGVIVLASGARLRVSPRIFEDIDRDLELFAQVFVPDYYFAEPKAEWVNPAVTDMVVGVGTAQTLRDFRACDAFDVLARLGEISVPLLAITGENDKLTPPKYAQAIADRVPGAAARIIRGAGHFVMVERAEETNAEIRSFLSRIV